MRNILCWKWSLINFLTVWFKWFGINFSMFLWAQIFEFWLEFSNPYFDLKRRRLDILESCERFGWINQSFQIWVFRSTHQMIYTNICIISMYIDTIVLRLPNILRNEFSKTDSKSVDGICYLIGLICTINRCSL